MNCANLDNDPEKSWCPLNCGQCYKLCSTGGSTQGRPQKAGWINWRTDDFFGGNIDWITSMKWWVCFVVFVFCLVLGSYHVVCGGCLQILTLSVLSISRYWSSCSKGIVEIVDIPPTDTGLDGTVVPRGEANPDFNAIMISVPQYKDMAGYRNYITAQHTFFFHMKIR